MVKHFSLNTIYYINEYYRYDEPYLLYREWREATNAFIKNKIWKYKYTETYNYIEWLKEKYQTNKELFAELKNKKGIIKLRKLYFEETKGKKYEPKFKGPLTKENALFKLILPVGITAMGKTTVGRMLKILYNIGLVEGDVITLEKGNTEAKFIDGICKEFETKTIIMADKNNHIRKIRKNLIDKLKFYYPNTLWIEAINWDIKSVPEREILKFTRERIDKRGENHEIITPEKASNYPHVVKSYFNNFEAVDLTSSGDSSINEVINVQFKESSINIVKKLIRALNLEPKTDEELQEVYQEAIQIEVKSSKPFRNLTPIYCGIRIKYLPCTNLALKYLKEFSEQNSKYANSYSDVKSIIEKSNFLQREHIIIATGKNNASEKLKYYNELIGPTTDVMNFNNPDLEVFITASSIVWTSSVVFIPVDNIESNKLRENDKNTDQNYTITLACTDNTNPTKHGSILQDIKSYYQNHSDLKSTIPTASDNITLIDESFVIDDTNKDKEKEITNPDSVYKLLPTSLKNTSFIKPITIIEGPNWKQLFIEPIKFKGYFTKFYY